MIFTSRCIAVEQQHVDKVASLRTSYEQEHSRTQQEHARTQQEHSRTLTGESRYLLTINGRGFSE